MVTPYDWQEAIGHRAQFIESRLIAGVPVLALSIEEGIVAATFHRQSAKIYEVYDRLMYAGIGQQSDVESLRVAAIDFAHREGFQRSEQDVTIQRIVTAMSQPIKDSFANFSSAPWIARALFMEINSTREEDKYYCIDYDGDYCTDRLRSCLAGTQELSDALEAQMSELDGSTLTATDAVEKLRQVLQKALDEAAEPDSAPGEQLQFEAVLLSRDDVGDRRLIRLTQVGN